MAQTKLAFNQTNGQVVSVLDYGLSDVGAAINAAIADGHKNIFVPEGKHTLLTTANIPANTVVFGNGRTTNESGFTPATEIEIGADVIGFQMGYTGNSGSFNSLRGFTLTKTGTHTKVGIAVGTTAVACSRTVLADLSVIGMGSHGILNTYCNLLTLRDIMCLSNGGDGIKFDDDAPDNNSCKFEGCIDVRGNTGHGLYIEGTHGTAANHSRSHFGGLIVAQSNGGDGVKIESKFNELTIYGENNTGDEINLTSDSSQNFIKAVNGVVVDSGTGNLVWEKDIGGIENSTTNYGGFNQLIVAGDGKIGINSNAGAVSGGWVRDHPSARRFENRFTDSSSSFIEKWIHDNNGGSAVDFCTFDVNTTASSSRALFNAAIGVNNLAANTNTPSGATAHAMPIYDESGILQGYIPVYAAQW